MTSAIGSVSKEEITLNLLPNSPSSLKSVLLEPGQSFNPNDKISVINELTYGIEICLIENSFDLIEDDEYLFEQNENDLNSWLIIIKKKDDDDLFFESRFKIEKENSYIFHIVIDETIDSDFVLKIEKE